MEFHQVPVGFGLALSANTAAMKRYGNMSKEQQQDILRKAHRLHSQQEMYTLVANLANGNMQ